MGPGGETTVFERGFVRDVVAGERGVRGCVAADKNAHKWTLGDPPRQPVTRASPTGTEISPGYCCIPRWYGRVYRGHCGYRIRASPFFTSPTDRVARSIITIIIIIYSF